MITPQEATEKTVEVLNSVCLFTVSAAAAEWLLDWWSGTQHSDEWRTDILASDDGEAELAGLVELLKGAGPFLNGLCTLAERLKPGAGNAIGPVELRALARYIAEKKAELGAATRLCDAVVR